MILNSTNLTYFTTSLRILYRTVELYNKAVMVVEILHFKVRDRTAIIFYSLISCIKRKAEGLI